MLSRRYGLALSTNDTNTSQVDRPGTILQAVSTCAGITPPQLLYFVGDVTDACLSSPLLPLLSSLPASTPSYPSLPSFCLRCLSGWGLSHDTVLIFYVSTNDQCRRLIAQLLCAGQPQLPDCLSVTYCYVGLQPGIFTAIDPLPLSSLPLSTLVLSCCPALFLSLLLLLSGFTSNAPPRPIVLSSPSPGCTNLFP